MAENQLISREWLEAARQRWDLYVSVFGQRPTDSFPKLGLDVSDQGKDLNACCLRYGGFAAPILTWSGVDPLVTAERAVDIAKKNFATEAFVDGNGVGAAVAPIMKRLGVKAHRTIMRVKSKEADDEIGEFDSIRDEALWRLREWLRTDPAAMLPPDPELLEELQALVYWHSKGRKIMITDTDTLRDLLKRSPDRLHALAFTFCPPPKKRAGLYNSTNYIKDTNEDKSSKRRKAVAA